MQEQERPGLTKCDRMSQISIVKDASRAHPVYIMNEQPAQSIPSDNYVEKSLILTAYWYDRNFYCLVILFAMLNRIPLSQDLHMRVNVAPNSRMSETENATGAASRGRKLQSARVGTLKSSIVQYWDKWCCILIQVGDTR